MKVADVMQKEADFVTPDASLLDVSHFIFEKNLDGIPVCKGKRVVGYITESEILSQVLPNFKEIAQRPSRSSRLESMEEKTADVLRLPASKIMNGKPITVTTRTPILKAYAILQTNHVDRLPVVDRHGRFAGTVSKGDIFNMLVGESIPLEAEEKFYEWLARHYDVLIDWKKRLKSELPDLIKLLRKEKAYKILDVASVTGEHVLALARNGFEVYGLESSPSMHRVAQAKRKKYPVYIQGKATFWKGNLKAFNKKSPRFFDAALLLGNALPHALANNPHILKEVDKALNLHNSMIILRLINFQKLFKVNQGLQSYVFRKTNMSYENGHVFIEFYTQTNRHALYNIIIFDQTRGKWVFRGINSTPVRMIGKKEIAPILKNLGFKDIEYFGGYFNGPLFREPFDPEKSDRLTIVAKR